MRQLRFHRALAVAIGLAAMPAEAALTCEQLFAIAESAIELRDQGHTLQQVLAGLKSKDVLGKLTADEIQVLRKTVTAVYLGSATAAEVALACKEVGPGK